MAERKRKRPTKRSTAKLAASGTTVRIETPKSSRQRKPSTTKVIVQEINPVEGFVGFLREHAIVGLSIGFIIGSQMSALVKVLNDSFINPLTQLLFGTALSNRTFFLHFHAHSARFYWGAVVYGLIEIILLLIFLYVAFKVLNLENLDKPKEPKK